MSDSDKQQGSVVRCSICHITLEDPKTVGQLLGGEWVCDSTSDTPSDCEIIHEATR